MRELDAYVCLLDMADICADATAQAILAAHGKLNKKAARFLDLVKGMNIRTSEFCYQQRSVGPLERSGTLSSGEQEKKS
ncbi:hypothetical protein [Bradyrhizobium sp. 195]|uniref:hypothetical protein n=1 Tax=Bradyrhizobium sp. 195 TaxID=2782662 RepID=UPI00200169E6|nr:hypothetical protein [Bradyrhizobium sp. 195]UPK23594.1 hypothetical protein IVB26_19440 [Bradyrhizobium sp. 195]